MKRASTVFLLTLPLLVGCVTVADHRKLQREVIDLKREGANRNGAAPRERLADLASRLDAVEQETEMLLVGTSEEGRSTWADWTLSAGTMVFTAGPLAAGSYLVRLKIDGAVSLLETDPMTLEFTEPNVTVP